MPVFSWSRVFTALINAVKLKQYFALDCNAHGVNVLKAYNICRGDETQNVKKMRSEKYQSLESPGYLHS